MQLVIVESPAKAKTIQKYLGGDFIVRSSYGHVRDLPTSRLGVDVEHDFTPKYVVPAKAKPVLAELKKIAKQADTIYFATDGDREGEAIAWHLATALKTPAKKIKRITFTEITKPAIQAAIKNPRQLDAHLIDAQQARRVLDRLVGYELSPLLWKKVQRGLSAGRVQSVAVRLIAEREKEISQFKTEEYWSLFALFHKGVDPILGKLVRWQDQTLKKLDLKNKEQVAAIQQALTNATYQVTEVVEKEKHRTPPPPFTTSTLQQAAGNQLGFSSKKTMLIAQQLYEGVELGSEGPVGVITYMRTDSVTIANEAAVRAAQTITQHFGHDFSLPSPRQYTTKAKGAQEAHEAIRPSDPFRLPPDLAAHLTPDQNKLYRLIWERFIASQMAAARFNTVSATITPSTPPNSAFRTTGTTTIFPGYLKVLPEKTEEMKLPPLAKGDTLDHKEFQPKQHFTEAPPRFSEANLVKALEEKGIGRPSTYAPTIDTIQKRGYVTKEDDKRLHPTEIGHLVNDLLTTHFPQIVDVTFTATMEESLDEIASGKQTWQPIIGNFYQTFHPLLEQKKQELNKKELTEEKTGEICPKCGGELVIKLGRFGKFKACSKFPDCKYTEAIGEEKELAEQFAAEPCPQCGRPLQIKRGRFGPFVGCTGYPECKYIKAIEKDTGIVCPACGQGKIIEKRSRRGRTFYACNRYPDCKQAYWSKPTGEKCPTCGSLLVYGAKQTVRCSNKDCQYTSALLPTDTPAPSPPT